MLKQQTYSLLRQFFFWMLIFASQRLLFLVYYHSNITAENIPFGELAQTFYYALALDLSTASYIIIIPFLLALIQLFTQLKWLDSINRIYTAIVLFVYLVIGVAELGLYGEWESKLSFKALLYLKQPVEVVDSVSNGLLVLGLLLLIGQFLFFYWMYRRWFFSPLQPTGRNPWYWKFGFVILVSLLLVVGVRGGVQEIPITSSQSYFSKYNILNLAAVNSGYNMAFSTIDYFQVEENNRFSTLPEEKAKEIVSRLHQLEKDTTKSILRFPRPNIVIVLLESWSGDLIESIGGLAGITPEFRKLENEALLFTRFYATGNRSQQAMASIYGGLPAIPITTLSDHPEKYHAVPSLIKLMNAAGYFTSFYFGGQLIYGNIKSYLVYNEFDLLVEGHDFDKKIPRGKMGVHDKFLFERFAKDLDRMQRPFFSTAFTLSSHSPYDYPQKEKLDHFEQQKEFVNSVFYTDQALGDFFETVKAKPWYDSTLFIVLADHSHPSHKNYPMRSFEYHNIPLLICGGALKEEYRAQQTDRVCVNADIPSTLLHQLNLPATDFTWSKDVFNLYTPEFAFFELNNGFGWKQPMGELVYNIKDDYYYVKPTNKAAMNQLDEEGKAYVQVLFQEFLDY